MVSDIAISGATLNNLATTEQGLTPNINILYDAFIVIDEVQLRYFPGTVAYVMPAGSTFELTYNGYSTVIGSVDATFINNLTGNVTSGENCVMARILAGSGPIPQGVSFGLKLSAAPTTNGNGQLWVISSFHGAGEGIVHS